MVSVSALRFERLYPENKPDFDEIAFKGSPIRLTWNPVVVHRRHGLARWLSRKLPRLFMGTTYAVQIDLVRGSYLVWKERYGSPLFIPKLGRVSGKFAFAIYLAAMRE